MNAVVYMNCNVKYKCDFLVHHSGRPGGAMQSAAGYQICRPGFESRQGTSICGFLLCIVTSNTTATS